MIMANLQHLTNQIRVFEIHLGLIIVLCRFHTIVLGRDICGGGGRGWRTTYTVYDSLSVRNNLKLMKKKARTIFRHNDWWTKLVSGEN